MFFLNSLCTRKSARKERWNTVSLQTFINEIYLRTAVDRFPSLAAAQQTVFRFL